MPARKESVGRYCPFCGSIISDTEFFCRTCHRPITDHRNLEAPRTDNKSGTYVVEVRKTWATGILSGVAVGLGQFYNGDTLKGIGFAIAFLAVSFGYVNLSGYTAITFFGIWLASITEAMVSSGRINRYTRPFRGTSYLFWLELIGLALIVLLHFYTGLPDIVYLQKIFPALDLWNLL